MHHEPNQLSGGQRQRVAIARVLVNDPAIIFADEPTGALDTRTARKVFTLLKQLHEQGHIILIVTYDLVVARHCECEIGRPDRSLGSSLRRRQHPDRAGRLAMIFWTIVRVAFKSLLASKLRTVPAMLGITITVWSVISVLARGAGAQAVLD